MNLNTALGFLKKNTWGRLWRACYRIRKAPLCHRSYWHAVLRSGAGRGQDVEQYLSAQPNPGAGIGHQMANWIAGYWWARCSGLKYAYHPFPSREWDALLGFGEDEVSIESLVRGSGYRVVRLPLFMDGDLERESLVRRIIRSYRGKKVVFLCAVDQIYRDQIGPMEDLQRKFHNAASRGADRLVFARDTFNIAIHVRRGDIAVGKELGVANHTMRWQGNDYFEKVLSGVLERLEVDRPVAIYLFSQGRREDFPEFEGFNNLHFCLDMGARDSFLHMVHADLLITSKSSFSYKPALLSKGIRVCPKEFWHAYPGKPWWILADEGGSLDCGRIPQDLATR